VTIILQLAILGVFVGSGWQLAHQPFTPWALAYWPLLTWFACVTAYCISGDLTKPPPRKKER
jgi:hypothetical protein